MGGTTLCRSRREAQEKCQNETNAREKVQQWSAFSWRQPEGLAVLDAFVAALVNVKKNHQPHFKLLLPHEDSGKFARFVEIRSAVHRDNQKLLAPALKVNVRNLLETRMEESSQPVIGRTRARRLQPVKKEEEQAGSHHCPLPGDKSGQIAVLTKFASMSKEENTEVAKAFDRFELITTNKYPRTIKSTPSDESVCGCMHYCGPGCKNREAHNECTMSSCLIGQACTNVGGIRAPQSLPKTIVAYSDMHAPGG